MNGISRAIDRALSNEVSPWKLCRPESDFKVWSIEQKVGSLAAATSSQTTVQCRSIHQWHPSSSCHLEIASVPIITGQHAIKSDVSLGNPDVLQRLFKHMGIPSSVLSCFLDNKIQFISFPGAEAGRGVYLLNFRQWAIAWNCESAKDPSRAILLWMSGLWARDEIANHVEPFLDHIADTYIDHMSPGLLGVLFCAKSVGKALADQDEEAFRTEQRLRELIRDGQLKQEDELGKLSAAHSWLVARAIRGRARLSTASSFLEYAISHRQPGAPNNVLAAQVAYLEALVLAIKSLTCQASKICEELPMHLSTIYSIIAQRDQATQLSIAAASQEIALQSKIDQPNSLEIAQASKKIAEDSRKDSSAMKMIAIVAMVYLPGTFVATCFSMDLFQWTGKASGVVNPRIWVYFLFTGVLTLLTISCFAGWTWWQDRHFPQESLEAQNSLLLVKGKNSTNHIAQRPSSILHAANTKPNPTSLPCSVHTIPSSPPMPRIVSIEPPEKDPAVNVLPAGLDGRGNSQSC